jgi:streptogramin lyase
MRRTTILLTAIALAALLAAPAAAQITPTITTFPSSDPVSPESHPYAIAAGPDGNIWFTDPYASRIGRMTTEGALTLQAPVPPASFEYDIAPGPDGAMWFVAQNPSTIGRIDMAGNILSKPLAEPLANPTHLTAGPEGAMWISESGAKRIGRMPATTPLATPDESRATADSPNDIAAGPDGNLWFTQYSASNIGRMTPAGSPTYFALPPGIQNPQGITRGPDGALWYTALNPPTVGRIATDGTQVTFPVPVTPFSDGLATGPDGALWYSAFDKVVRFTLDGATQAFPVTEPAAGVISLTAGPDGNVWFVESNAGRIGRITTPPLARTGSAESVGALGATLTGVVIGHSQPTTATVEYGPLGAPATGTASVSLPPSAAEQPVSITVDGLAPASAYSFRVVAANPTGSAFGSLAELRTAPMPSCRVTRTKRGKRGVFSVFLACDGTDSARATATSRLRRRKAAGRSARGKRTFVYGRTRAPVTNGRAVLRVRPTRRARAELRRRGRLKLKLNVDAIGGGTSTAQTRTLRIRFRQAGG